jgi:hypothetical protein
MGTALGERQPFLNSLAVTSTSSAAPQYLVPFPSTPMQLDSILGMNSDSIAHVVNVGIYITGSLFFAGSVSIPAGAGTLGTPAVDILAGAFPPGALPLWLDTLHGVTIWLSVAIVTGSVHVHALGGYV